MQTDAERIALQQRACGLANIIRQRTRRLYRDADVIRRLTAELDDIQAALFDTDGGHGHGAGSAAADHAGRAAEV